MTLLPKHTSIARELHFYYVGQYELIFNVKTHRVLFATIRSVWRQLN